MAKSEKDVEKRNPHETGPNARQACHDALISNDELRQAFNNAREEGMSEVEAHIEARRTVFGEDWEPSGSIADLIEQTEGLDDATDGGETGNSTEKAQGTFDYEKVDDALEEAHENVVQWKAGVSNPDLSKAPEAWASSDDVPDFVLDQLREIIRSGDVVWDGGYEKLPPGSRATIMRLLEDKLTQPQGWSLGSLKRDVEDALGDVDVDDGYLVQILRDDTGAVLNTAREEAYAEREDSEEYVYSWDGPNDHRTTETCLAIEDRIEDEGGAVPMPRLKQILLEEAQAHSDAEGTPERVSDWIPHFQCRRTFNRRVQSLG